MTVIFKRINFREATGNRFRAFAKQWGHTHSDTLDAMVDFFVHYKISPFGELATDLNSIEINIKKRINSLVAIIKDIEKHQTKPTTSMIQLLFEHSPRKTTSPRLVEKKQKEPTDDFFKTAMEAIELERKHTELQRQHAHIQEDLKELLQRIRVQKSSFGKTRMFLDMNPKELEVLKNNYKID